LLNINLSDKKHAPLTNLPIPLTNFIGREREVAEVKRLLTRSTQPDVTPSQAPTRLLTLTGAGGVGKTRLANQVATVLLSDFAHGVWLVELAALTDATLAPLAVARALAVNAPTSMTLTDALIEHLRAKHVLLLLDNCEHLVVACAMLVTRLLQACPFLQILATSREPLQVTGETVWRVPSLSLQAAAAAQAEAVQFFIANAYASQPSLTLTPHQTSLIHHICQRLDGIPLAIELAAARVRHLTIEQIAARLDDRFTLLTQGRRDALPRHQTLRATLDWSYQLLSEPERELFARLSVFAGGWRLEAAMQLADDLHAESLHTALVDKSLVSAVPRDGVMRYEMLDTVRAYARAQLEATHTTTTMRDKHLEIFLRLTEQAEPTLHSSTQNQGLQRLAAEHDTTCAQHWNGV
jgi:predicted ATPase